MGLFDRVFRGSDEMFAKAEAEINAVVAELGESAPMKMPAKMTAMGLFSASSATGMPLKPTAGRD